MQQARPGRGRAKPSPSKCQQQQSSSIVGAKSNEAAAPQQMACIGHGGPIHGAKVALNPSMQIGRNQLPESGFATIDPLPGHIMRSRLDSEGSSSSSGLSVGGDIMAQIRELSVGTKKGSSGISDGDDSGVSLASLHSPASPSFEVAVCDRPGFGRKGRRVLLEANYFIQSLPDVKIYRYQLTMTKFGARLPVDMAGKCDSLEREERRKAAYDIYWEMITHNPHVFQHPFAQYYDRQKQLFTLHELPLKQIQAQTFMIQGVNSYIDANQTGSYMVKLEYVDVIQLSDLSQVLVKCENFKDFSPLQVLDVITSQALYFYASQTKHGNDAFTPFGRSFFRPSEEFVDLGSGRQMHVGFLKSNRPVLGNWKDLNVQPPEGHFQLALNVNTQKTAFYKVQSVIDFANEILNKDIRRFPLQFFELAKLKSEMFDVFVDAPHRGDRFRFAVKSVSKEGARFLQAKIFNPQGGRPQLVSVEKFFQEKYNIRLQFPNLPCLVFNFKRETQYVPMELCRVSANQRVSQKKISALQTSELIKKTAVPPAQRRKEILDVVHKDLATAMLLPGTQTPVDPFLDQLNLQRSIEMMKVDGRVINPPAIQYASGRRIQPQLGQWDKKDAKFLLPATCRKWALIVLDTTKRVANDLKQQDRLAAFMDCLAYTASEQGLKWPPLPCNINDNVVPENEQFLESAFKYVLDHYHSEDGPVDVIVVMADKSCKGGYAETKRCGDLVFDVATQYLLTNKSVLDVAKNWIARDAKSQQRAATTCFQIALKLNSKLGGISSQIAGENGDEVVKKYLQRPTLYVGADVTHPPPQSKRDQALGLPPKEPSIAAIIGSKDLRPADYTSVIQVQDPRREPIDNLKEAMIEIIQGFIDNNRMRPDMIIFWRDGVSEGQFYEIITNELAAIRSACATFGADFRPGITFVIVAKRHHTRFFPTAPSAINARLNWQRNIEPGTVVDVGPVHPTRFEFFLTAHQGIQGTSRPTKYVVLHDDNDFKADDLQQLAFYLCHAFVRCTKAVSLPAPVYYAHLAAARAKEHFNSLEKRQSECGSSASGGSASLMEDLKDLESKIKACAKQGSRLYFC